MLDVPVVYVRLCELELHLREKLLITTEQLVFSEGAMCTVLINEENIVLKH